MESNNKGVFNNGTISIGEVSMPKGGGAIKGMGETFSSNPFTGVGNFSIPIKTSKGRGFEPDISLNYNSGAGNGPFGLGFSISLPYISRNTEKGVPTYEDILDKFILSNSSELVKTCDNRKQMKKSKNLNSSWEVTSYLPRVEGDFSRIEYWKSKESSYWKITTKDNITSIYGKSLNSKVANPNNDSQIFMWLIEESFDSKGNKIEYIYKQENNENIIDKSNYVDRRFDSYKYIHKIRYGNYFDKQKKEKWAFEVVFDYGEYELEDTLLKTSQSNPYVYTNMWKVRKDSFSSYRSGFEIRICRLCKNILMFHKFENELGEIPCLVNVTNLKYEETLQMSMLSEVQLKGYRRNKDNSYFLKSMPPIKLGYSSFNPNNKKFNLLKTKDDSNLQGYLQKTEFNFIDIYGDGLPGILMSNEESTFFWRAEGDGKYGFLEKPIKFPIEKDLTSSNYFLMSLEGNGKLNFIVSKTERAGFYECESNGDWKQYMDFEYFPMEFTRSSRKEMVDINGRGLIDIAIFGDDYLNVYSSIKKSGFSRANRIDFGNRISSGEFPYKNSENINEFIGFGNVLGDGLYHRIRVRNGCFECWPNCGHGNFGEKILLRNAPKFDEDLDISRIHFADIDGSGTMDICYVYLDRVDIYLNLSGNRFSDAISIPLPENYSKFDQINFEDVNGNGASCMIFTKVGEIIKHYVYDFTNNSKPYLLTNIDNSLGMLTNITYSSSVKFYLEDRALGKEWQTKLPFPLHVVEKIEFIDEISESKFTEYYKYHSGYYDYVERKFRGFGFVENWNSEKINSSLENPLIVPTTYIKKWYHTGCCDQLENISKLNEEDFFSEDLDAYVLPDIILDSSINKKDSEELIEAYISLAGKILREETYGLDSDIEISDIPYTVSETNFKIVKLQDKIENNFGVFYSHPTECITYNYERLVKDPRIAHKFILDVDKFGNIEKSCEVYYPRRFKIINQNSVYSKQYNLNITAECTKFINETEDFNLIGIAYEHSLFEIGEVSLNGKIYFSYDEIKTITNESFCNVVNYNESFKKGRVQARCISCDRKYFWNEHQDNLLDLGKITDKALLHHQEFAVMPETLVNDIFADRINDNILVQDCGYIKKENYWWNRGLVQSYFTREENGFFMPISNENLFIEKDSKLYCKKYIEYDEYRLFPIKIGEYLSEQISNESEFIIDYITTLPKQLKDINGNIYQVIFDPLAMVIAKSNYGIVDESFQGNGDLDIYKYLENATFKEVIKNNQKYLQMASEFFFYDLWEWSDNKKPACFIQLVRENYLSEIQTKEEDKVQINIGFSDGFGRNIEQKTKVDSGKAILYNKGNLIYNKLGEVSTGYVDERWQVSGRVVYNNTGKPIKQFKPYFSSTSEYEQQKYLDNILTASEVIYYDSILRVVKIEKAKGIPSKCSIVKNVFTKVKYSPWEEIHYDENDTLVDSDYFNEYINNYPENPTVEQEYEKKALLKASKFYNTPEKKVFDNMGNQYLFIRDNLGEVYKDSFKEIACKRGISVDDIWNELLGKEYIKPSKIQENKILSGWVSEKFQPYSSNFKLEIDEKYESCSNELIDFMKKSCLTTFNDIDVTGKIKRSVDARLYYSNISEKTDFCNFKYFYDMKGNEIYVESADAGIKLNLLNMYNKPTHLWDLRGFHKKIYYDNLQRIKEIYADGRCESGLNINQTVEKYVYGEFYNQDIKKVKSRNLIGKIYKHYDSAGIAISDIYDLNGKAISVSRQFASDYKNEINWDKISSVQLEEDVFHTKYKYDALERLKIEITPDLSIYKAKYNQLGLLNGVDVFLSEENKEYNFIKDIEYNANKQRTKIYMNNGLITQYTYDDIDYRLRGIKSIRTINKNEADKGNEMSTFQELKYIFDPCGNVMTIIDSSLEAILKSKKQISPVMEYTYDAMYQLINATGRKHSGVIADKSGCGFGNSKYIKLGTLHINDSEKIENYREMYGYDDSENLVSIKHISDSLTWIKSIDIDKKSNHSRGIKYGNKDELYYETNFDENGNMRNLETISQICWNYKNNISHVDTLTREDEICDSDYYIYDANGQRVRKVSERKINTNIFEIEEKFYIGNFEIKKIKRINNKNETIILSRKSIKVMDDKKCISMIYFWNIDERQRETKNTNKYFFKYQLDNSNGSYCVEINENAELITYEEYYPYGGTALILGEDDREVNLKEYRYSAKERDLSTGLYYYGERYYASHIGRWVSADPAGKVNGLNLYTFTINNPIRYSDDFGMDIGDNFTFERDDLLYGLHESRSKDIYMNEVRAANGRSRLGVGPIVVDNMNNLFLGVQRGETYGQGKVAINGMTIRTPIVSRFMAFLEHNFLGSKLPRDSSPSSIKRRIISGCKAGMLFTVASGKTIRFVLDGLNIRSICYNTHEKRSYTERELRFIYKRRNDANFMQNIKFYKEGREVEAPWISNSKWWNTWYESKTVKGYGKILSTLEKLGYVASVILAPLFLNFVASKVGYKLKKVLSV
ncbi:sugar-binding protein [Clostridioides sp. ES-S-0145-01]|uniref:SpvB/TcaC N-terminal domain-containing protein n=1 Tax=Clostridioides sp. ES-S-0145-01 TaxID=2770784 RepID=UPI001D10CBD2|nr:sugar-binding protein [Clostridioides sp. ES-S-0145-01]